MGNTSDKPAPAQLPSRKPQLNGGDTRASRHHSPEPQLPHERDESSNSQEQPTTDARVEHAASDVKRGLVDTGREPVTDELAREHFPSKPNAEPGDVDTAQPAAKPSATTGKAFAACLRGHGKQWPLLNILLAGLASGAAGGCCPARPEPW